jgi:hypothetical protein
MKKRFKKKWGEEKKMLLKTPSFSGEKVLMYNKHLKRIPQECKKGKNNKG